MEQLFIPGSIIADYFYLGLFLLVAASLIAGYVDAIAGGVGTGKIGEYHRYGGCD